MKDLIKYRAKKLETCYKSNSNGGICSFKKFSCKFFNLIKWPVYFQKTKGCEIWDLDNNKFYDFSLWV